MICRMFRQSCIAMPRRASAARGAAQIHAIFARVQQAMAGSGVIAPRPQRGAGGLARRCAGIAGFGHRRGQIQLRFQRQGPAKADHQPLIAVHQQLDRALPNPPCAQCPSVKRMIGRRPKGKQRLCPQIASHSANNAARPAIHRIRATIRPFGRIGKVRPKPSRRAQHQQGLRARRQAGVIHRMKSAQNG